MGEVFFLPRGKPEWSHDLQVLDFQVFIKIHRWGKVGLSGVVFFQAGLEFTMQPRLASDSQQSSGLCFLSLGIARDITPT